MKKGLIFYAGGLRPGSFSYTRNIRAMWSAISAIKVFFLMVWAGFWLAVEILINPPK